MNKVQLTKLLKSYKLWLEDNSKGVDLRGASLTWKDLEAIDLKDVGLKWSDLGLTYIT